MIEVLKPGLYTSVQDLGRIGYRKQGVPLSGAMDSEAALLANKLVGNLASSAVLECTMLGPTLRFMSATTFVVTGGSFKMLLNASEILTHQVVSAKQNDVLTIGTVVRGMRCYLAVEGGIHTPEILGSRSFYSSITPSEVVKKGDKLPIGTIKQKRASKNISEVKTTPFSEEIEVYKGSEINQLSVAQQKVLLTSHFEISPQSNRMAYLLDGRHQLSALEIITAPVQPGTVQLTPSGKIIVLMRDAQVTGGYARIFQLTEAAINNLAQMRGGQSVRFKLSDCI